MTVAVEAVVHKGTRRAEQALTGKEVEGAQVAAYAAGVDTGFGDTVQVEVQTGHLLAEV